MRNVHTAVRSNWYYYCMLNRVSNAVFLWCFQQGAVMGS